jgi:hypothetical protein
MPVSVRQLVSKSNWELLWPIILTVLFGSVATSMLFDGLCCLHAPIMSVDQLAAATRPSTLWTGGVTVEDGEHRLLKTTTSHTDKKNIVHITRYYDLGSRKSVVASNEGSLTLPFRGRLEAMPTELAQRIRADNPEIKELGLLILRPELGQLGVVWLLAWATFALGQCVVVFFRVMPRLTDFLRIPAIIRLSRFGEIQETISMIDGELAAGPNIIVENYRSDTYLTSSWIVHFHKWQSWGLPGVDIYPVSDVVRANRRRFSFPACACVLMRDGQSINVRGEHLIVEKFLSELRQRTSSTLVTT